MAWTERYVRADAAGGGDGTTDTNSGANGAWTLAEAIAASNAGYRMNVRAGTYANTTTSRTFGVGAGAATTTSPKWWRGFTSTAGDLDNKPTSVLTAGTDFPLFTFTTGSVTMSGVHQWFTNIEFRGTAPGTRLVGVTGSKCKFHRCRFDCQEAASTSYAFRQSVDGVVCSQCWFKGTGTANHVVVNEERAFYLGCSFHGGGNGLYADATSSTIAVLMCIFDDCGDDGIDLAGSGTWPVVVDRCSFYSCGGNGIRIATNIPILCSITNSIFSQCGAYGINNATGTNTNIVYRANNLFYSNTSGDENGFGDSPYFDYETDSASPYEDAANDDFTPKSTSNAIDNAMPGVFENL